MWTVALIWLKKLAWPIAALLALASFLLSRRGGGSPSAEDAYYDELEDALLETVDERRRRMEVEADAELEEKRSGSRADRLAGALRRASVRLGRGD